MRTLFSAVALALALSAGSALGADLPSIKGPPPPPPPPPPLWTGFYAGLNAGYGWGATTNVGVGTAQLSDGFGSNTLNTIFGTAVPPGFPFGVGPLFNTILDPNAGASALAASGIANVQDSGFIGGGQIGYNYQWGASWVVGIEADIQGAGIRGQNGFAGGNAWNAFNQNITFPGLPAVLTPILNAQLNRSAAAFTDITKHTDWLGTVRGRLGWLATPTLLVFGTGGLAYGGVEARVFQNQTINNTASLTLFPNAPNPAARTLALSLPFSGASVGRIQDTRVGWTAGGGLEWLFAPNWSVKTEALYYDLGHVTFANSPLMATGATLLIPGVAFPFLGTINQSVTRVRFDGVIARVGVNYHFNWGAAPVVASY
jgi:outer membrane immunogenic protein